MCTPNNINYVKLESNIMIFALFSFILSSIGAGMSLYVIIKEEYYHKQFQITYDLQHVFDINLDKNIITLVAGIVCVIFLLAMVFSVLLAVGIKKNKPGFVLAYFGYGTMLTILMILSALLEFLQYYWPVATSTIIFSAIYMRCLMLVHTVYDLMQKGLMFGSNRHDLVENET